jgi:hypothetical protein
LKFYNHVAEAVRICENEGCSTELSEKQSKYCSRACVGAAVGGRKGGGKGKRNKSGTKGAEPITVSFSPEEAAIIDQLRGEESRSSFVYQIVLKALAIYYNL